MVNVVAALIHQGGSMLICQRSAFKARALLWEFPGGKVETGETPEQALCRECCEELDIDVVVGAKCMETVYAYSDITIRLSLYEARILRGTPRLVEHAALKWIRPKEAASYRFSPADEAFVENAGQWVKEDEV